MNLNKQASVCASVALKRLNADRTKTAAAWPLLLGLGALGLGGGWAYHNNAIRNAYTKGNRDLMTELRPLLAGINAPRGGFDL